MVDRSGLWHANDITYSWKKRIDFFSTLAKIGSRTRAAIDAILKSEDSWFEWCTIAAEADNAGTTVLLQFIDLYTSPFEGSPLPRLAWKCTNRH